MLDKKIIDLVNHQVNKEMYSAYLYLSMANYYAEKNLEGFAHWFTLQAKEEYEHAEKFMNQIDSAGVYHNVSTRFADGFRYGFGAEVGISTNKTHARGPVGLSGLMSYKWILAGHGEIVSDYASGRRFFHHKDLI